jgi:hypothetical protein
MLFEATSWLLARTEEKKVKTRLSYILTHLWLIDWTANNRLTGSTIFISFCVYALTFCFTKNRIYPTALFLLYLVIFQDIRFVIDLFCFYWDEFIYFHQDVCFVWYTTVYFFFMYMIYYINVQSLPIVFIIFVSSFIFNCYEFCI